MSIASLKSQSLKCIVDFFCKDYSDSEVLVQRFSRGCDDVFACRVLREITRSYPCYVDDKLALLLYCTTMTSLCLKDCENVTIGVLKVILNRCSYLSTLDISGCNNLISLELLNVLGACQNIKILIMNSCLNLDCDFLHSLLSLHPNLEVLSCEECCGLNKYIGNSNTVLSNLRLKDVNFSLCLFISDLFVRRLLSACERLKILNLSYTHLEDKILMFLSKDGINLLTPAVDDSDITVIYETDHLEQQYGDFYHTVWNEYDIISTDSESNPSYAYAKELIKDGWDIVTLNDMSKSNSPMLKNSPTPSCSLKTIDLTNIDCCYETFEKSFTEFVNSHPDLLHFHISTHLFTDDHLKLLAKRTDLQSISVVSCCLITDAGVNALIEGSSCLKTFDLRGVPFISDDVFVKLVTTHTKLQLLAVAESLISDNVLEVISKTLNDTLLHIDLSWCDNITDSGVCSLVKHCTELKYLDLRQCSVTMSTINTLESYGCKLTTLGLCGIKGKLDNSSCISLATNLPSLGKIDLSWSEQITDVGIVFLLRSCLHLHYANLTGLCHISSQPFLPIISCHEAWCCHRKILQLKLQAQLNRKDVSKFECLDDNFYMPFRSASYAPELRKLILGYCRCVNDSELAEITAICRGTLHIEDYYGEVVKPKWQDKVRLNKTM